ncbi:MAG TPA: transposase [Thermomicrobiales bacterium]|jgi:transposase-like protein|nr:transposase [Thermomicrobiales bacterium]
MGRGRTFSREFKLSVVREIASGAKRPAQACREYELSEGVLLRWRQEYDARGEDAFTPREVSGVQALEQRIAELERFCGQLALENAALKKGLSGRASRSDTR